LVSKDEEKKKNSEVMKTPSPAEKYKPEKKMLRIAALFSRYDLLVA